MTVRPSRLVLGMLVPAFLSGCALLTGGKPAQLYRLEAPAEPAAAISPIPPAARTIRLMPVRADPAIDDDRMLGSIGAKTSYIARARWLSPVPAQFEQLLRDAVRRDRPAVLLVDRRDGLTADRALQITISRFEARFDTPEAAPLIVFDGEADLIDLGTRAAIDRRHLVASRRASSADIAAIVAAFGAAATEAAGQAAGLIAP